MMALRHFCLYVAYHFSNVCYTRISVFFFKQKTAYEMRISDWSSDVCSSDLREVGIGGVHPERRPSDRALAERKPEIAGEFEVVPGLREIGRASCRERVCQCV